MDLGLTGKVAIVAAASKGLGRAVALELAREGADLAICSRDEARIRDAASAIRETTGRSVVGEAVDVSDPTAVREFVQRVRERFGTVHILVTNAGGPPAGNFDQIQEKDWLKAIPLLLGSTVALTQAVVPLMRANRWGRIINITSITVKQPEDGLLLSNSIRAAVVGFAKSLANELAPDNILVNNVCPGYTRTERVEDLAQAIAQRKTIDADQVVREWEQSIPVKRLGTPQEFAALVAFLASERASYITGTTIPVDGGYVKSTM